MLIVEQHDPITSCHMLINLFSHLLQSVGIGYNNTYDMWLNTIQNPR